MEKVTKTKQKKQSFQPTITTMEILKEEDFLKGKKTVVIKVS